MERNSDTAVKFVTSRKLAQQFSQLSEYRERGFGIAFTLGTIFPSDRVSFGPLRRERFRKKVTSPNTLQIDPEQRVNSRAITIHASFADFNFCERAKLEATRMIERKGERLCWGFNVKFLYKKVPRRRSTYVKFQSTQTHDT